ncbi:hypothetical protein HTV45_08830 [Streptomyces sp. CHD11]|uniref:DUF5980 family protein n=1 Tax=Streptomyces sp. CHD11 TaxID=2741325 RepID=UPI001BFC30A9|nr:DUF5980 family protein [Streptomyces sp. CHD11]MBT3150991.1 hypothetical protein [Streptomyces sp. CHD11]
MKASHRGAGLLLGLFSALSLPLLGASPASASTPTWNLEAEGQQICTQGTWFTYAFAPVSGTWSTPIKTGIRDLPPGSYMTDSDTIPPGTNERDPEDGALTVNGWLFVQLNPAPVGEYTAEIYATDGKSTQTDTIKITYKDRCY